MLTRARDRSLFGSQFGSQFRSQFRSQFGARLLTLALPALALLAAATGLPAAASAPQAPDERRPADEAVRPEVRLRLRDGRVAQGVQVDEDDQRIVLLIEGIETAFDVADIVDLQTLPPLLERYRERRAAIDDRDLIARVELAKWLRDNAAYRTARAEVQGVLAIDADHAEARGLLIWLNQQIELIDRTAARRGEAPPENPDADPDAPDPDAPGDSAPGRRLRSGGFPVLTTDEVNLIRVFEINLDDPPRLEIPRATITRFLDLYGADPRLPQTAEGRDALYRKRPAAVLDLMFRLQARDLYAEVRVHEDPESFRLFREEVHARWLITACASASCHGGEEAGRLWLTTTRQNRDTSVYTNFLILDRFRTAEGEPLINYQAPAESRLLHMGLPRSETATPHPQAGPTSGRRGWRPIFRDQQDIRFRRATEWIASMYTPRPTYGIDYTPPVPRGATRDGALDTGPVER